MRLARHVAAMVIYLASFALVIVAFYVSVVAVLVALALFLPLGFLSDWVGPPDLEPEVLDLSHWEPDPEPEPAPYDVRTRITPKRLWSDG